MWLEDKYLNLISVRLPLFKKKRHGLYNCRCPICGDSKKSKTIARGYFYERQNKMFYDCKNCDAKGRKTFNNFLEWFDPQLHQEFKLEMFKETGKSRVKRKKVSKAPKKKYNLPKIDPNSHILDGLLKVSEADEKHSVIEYVKSRQIPEDLWDELYWVPNLKSIVEKIDKYDATQFENDSIPRLIIPFYDQNSQLTHLQGRALVDCKLRYITLDIVDNIPKIYGMNKIDKTQKVRVFEGPIDSMFVDNACAKADSQLFTSAKALNMSPDEIIVILDREPRNEDIIKAMEKCIQQGYNICILPEFIKGKDINQYVLNGYDVEDLISKYTYKGLKASLEMSSWKKR